MLAACTRPEPSATVAATIAATADGTKLGTVRFRDSVYGLLVEPDLHGMAPGPHAAHVHEKGSCAPSGGNGPSAGHESTPGHGEMTMGGEAGAHFDPKGTGRHSGPYGDGHLGDLPDLIVEADGTSTIPMLAPRLKAADLRGHALILHGGPDHYLDGADHAHAMGARTYCGVIG
jgi:Cu-Zn family superoxide dismutase